MGYVYFLEASEDSYLAHQSNTLHSQVALKASQNTEVERGEQFPANRLTRMSLNLDFLSQTTFTKQSHWQFNPSQHQVALVV